MKRPKVLVTGGLGFVGTKLVRSLMDDKYPVWSFDLKVGLDIRDYEHIRARLEEVDPDWIFHLAGQPYVPESTSDTKRAYQINTIGTLNLFEAMRHSGSHARVLVSGTVEEYGHRIHGATLTESSLCLPSTLYGASKLAASQLAQVYGETYGIPVVVTRAVNHTGPGHSTVYAVPSFAKRVAEAEAGLTPGVRHGNLKAYRYYLDVRDVVMAYRKAILLEPGIYNIGPSRGWVTMGEILEWLIRFTDQQIMTIEDPTLYRPAVGNQARIQFTKFRDAAAWIESIDFMNETLKEMLDYWRGHYAAQ